MGFVGEDPSLRGGKNLVNFLLIYAIGNTLKAHSARWQIIPKRRILMCFIVYNSLLVALFTLWSGRVSTAIYERIFFHYDSIGLLLNAVMFFVYIGHLQFHSRFVNFVAKSSLAIYIIHFSDIFLYGVIGPICMRMLSVCASNQAIVVGCVITIAICVLIMCVAIDKALTPIWRGLDKLALYCQKRVISSYGEHSI